MTIDLRRIKDLLSKVETKRRKSADLAQKEEQEKQKQQESDLERKCMEKHLEVERIIEGLQAEIERATEYGNRSKKLLWLNPNELLFEPKRYGGIFESEMVSVWLVPGGKAKHSILRGYKPNCLPDYAKKLFNYCRQNSLTTLLSEASDYSTISTPDRERWKWKRFLIEIYW
jgi:hypothetical protein